MRKISTLSTGPKSATHPETRTKLHLSQAAFATKFRVPIAILRDWEQARITVPDFAVVYVRGIALHPEDGRGGAQLR